MKTKIIISIFIAYIISFIFSPPDILSQFIFGFESAFICCISLLILSKQKFVKSSSNSMHTLVCVLVCMISIFLVELRPLHKFSKLIPGSFNWSVNLSSVRSSRSTRVGNMWIDHLSDDGGIFSKETEWVICSLDQPKTSSYDGSTKVLTFSNGNSIKIKRRNGETVWVNKQHEVKFLGPILNKENIPHLFELRRDENLDISSPDELLEIVNKLKAERKVSVDSS